MTIIGLALYFYAPKLCRNVIFHYGTGVLAGITFSLLLVTYFVQRKVTHILILCDADSKT